MSPYNAYSSSLSSVSSYNTPSKYSSRTGYSSLSSSSNYSYRPPALSSNYRSPSGSCSSYSYPSRNLSSYLNNRLPRFASVSSYTTSTSSDSKWKSTNERLYGPSVSSISLPALSRTPDRRSLPSSAIDNTPIAHKSGTWSSAVSDDEDDDKVGVRVGLNNLGNTCFMNAVLQCLCHTQPLVDLCIKGTYLRDINHQSPTRGDLMKVFAEFVKKLSECKAKNAISPHQLRREVQRYAPRFLGDNQQDSQEFLRYLLQGLHDDINRVKFRRSSVSRKDSYGNDSLGNWTRYKDTDDSLIVDLFAGQLKSTLKCTVCNNDSITYDPFWDLSLPLPEGSRNATTLRQCFNLFTAPEILDGPNEPFCEKCKKKSRSSKKMEVNKFPNLKRFSANYYGQKLNMMVDCPMKLNNFSDFASQSYIGDSYSLYGVIDHDGSNNYGHYTAKCRNPSTTEWWEFNDIRVTKTSNIVTYKTYILFYIQDGRYR